MDVGLVDVNVRPLVTFLGWWGRGSGWQRSRSGLVLYTLNIFYLRIRFLYDVPVHTVGSSCASTVPS